MTELYVCVTVSHDTVCVCVCVCVCGMLLLVLLTSVSIYLFWEGTCLFTPSQP